MQHGPLTIHEPPCLSDPMEWDADYIVNDAALEREFEVVRVVVH